MGPIINRLLVSCLMGAFVSGCGMALGDTLPSPKNKKAEPARKQETAIDLTKPRLAGKWQERMLKELAEGPYTSAYGLFSGQGGWTPDEGQTIVLYNSQAVPIRGTTESRAEVLVVDIVGKDIKSRRSLSSLEWEALSKEIKIASSLTDVNIDAGFDQVNYEYVEAVREGKNARVTHRIYIRNASPDHNPMPKHQALMKAFEDIRVTAEEKKKSLEKPKK